MHGHTQASPTTRRHASGTLVAQELSLQAGLAGQDCAGPAPKAAQRTAQRSSQASMPSMHSAKLSCHAPFVRAKSHRGDDVSAHHPARAAAGNMAEHPWAGLILGTAYE